MKRFLSKEFVSILIMLAVLVSGTLSFANAQTEDTTDISNPKFKLSVCDGPDRSGLPGGNPDRYVPCNFEGLMRQIQFLVNMAIILGVVIALFMFTWAGFLYMQGAQDKVKHAKEIFQKTLLGFVMMLSAWLIVYTIVNFLTGGSGYTNTLFTK